MISGHGSANPLAIFIGDAAQKEDLRTNYALSGNQERLLKEFCTESHLNFYEFWRTTVIKDEAPSEEPEENLKFLEASNYPGILRDEVNELKPHLLIPLGELSFRFLTGLTGIRKFRGSVMLADGKLGFNDPVKVLPILGPAPYLYQDYSLRFITKIDFQKIPKYLNDSPPPENLHNLWIAKSSAALRAFFERSYEKAKFLVFDIETYMGIPTCISFCFDGYESACVPLLDSTIDLDNRVLMMDSVAKLLASPIPKVNQNIKYDWKILERWGFKVNNVIGDTMLASSTLYCEFPKNLGFLTSIYTDLPYFKDEGREFDPQRHKKEQFYLYNAKDSLATHQIYTQQIEEIKEQGVGEVYSNLIQLMPIYRKMEDTGMRIDEERRQTLVAKYESLLHIQELKLKTLLNMDYVNPRSPKQIGEIVFERLGYKKIRGVKGTDEESLELLREFGEAVRSPIYGRDILEIILNCRKIHKVLEILELPYYPDGRFRCEFNLAGTENGRTSAGKTTDQVLVFKENKAGTKTTVSKVNLGHSFQTIGKHGFEIDETHYGIDIRSIFVADSGYSLVEVDLSQAEARVDAVLANNFDMLSVFDGPIGIHRLTGSWVFGCDPREIKKNVLVDGIDRYFMAKTVRHAGERNMRAERLVMMTQKPLSVCKKILETFHKYQPEIRANFHRDVINAVNNYRCLIAPNGRRRDFFNRIDSHTYNEAISFLPQAIVGDQMKFSMIPLNERAPWALPVVEAHDGVTSLVPKGREEEYRDIFFDILKRPIDFRKCSIPREIELVIPAEAAFGENWQELEEMK